MSDYITDVCRALAHPARRALLCALSEEECDVGNLGACCELDQPTVSKHLAALRAAGLVNVRIDGRRRCYSLANEEWLKALLELLGRFGDPTVLGERAENGDISAPAVAGR